MACRQLTRGFASLPRVKVRVKKDVPISGSLELSMREAVGDYCVVKKLSMNEVANRCGISLPLVQEAIHMEYPNLSMYAQLNIMTFLILNGMCSLAESSHELAKSDSVSGGSICACSKDNDPGYFQSILDVFDSKRDQCCGQVLHFGKGDERVLFNVSRNLE